jgi:mono/diheme cytochrome c family protein
MNPLYAALLHTHETLISLYVLIIAIKTVLLLANKTEALGNFRKKTRVIGEMVLPTLFLVTGLYLAYTANVWTETWFLIKFSLIIVSIVTGLIAFRKNSKILAILTFLIFLYIILISYRKNPELKKAEKAEKPTGQVVTNPSDPGYDVVKHGQYLYFNTGCNSCHGDAGNLGNHGAKDLTKSVLDSTATENVIRDGRGNIMASYGKKLKDPEIHALARYVQTLRKP